MVAGLKGCSQEREGEGGLWKTRTRTRDGKEEDEAWQREFLFFAVPSLALSLSLHTRTLARRRARVREREFLSFAIPGLRQPQPSVPSQPNSGIPMIQNCILPYSLGHDFEIMSLAKYAVCHLGTYMSRKLKEICIYPLTLSPPSEGVRRPGPEPGR